MKFLTAIFAFYILLLPCMFCSDNDECIDASKTEQVQPDVKKDAEQHNEPCNPFCSCACCAHIFSPNAQFSNLTVAKPSTKKQEQFFYHNISLSSDFFGNIWQPPKTS